MLPKFSNLFSHFPRTSSTFRQGFFNSSQAGGSAGGAKYNAGNRFYNYNGYTGSGRAFTQANNLGANDDERHPQFRRVAFANPAFQPSSRLSVTPVLTRARRNSTSAIPSKVSESAEPLTPNPTGSSAVLPTTSHSATQVASEAAVSSSEARELSDEWAGAEDPVYQEFSNLPKSASYELRESMVVKYMAEGKFTTVPAYNAGLATLLVKRPVGHPINKILELYNDMVKNQFAPNKRTYHIVLFALCQRDQEIWEKIDHMQSKFAKRELAGKEFIQCPEHLADHERLSSLKREKNFASSMVLFKTLLQLSNDPFPVPLYKLLIRTCADNENLEAAIRVFSHFERFSKGPRSFEMYKELIRAYSRAKDIKGAQEVFNDFLKVSATGNISATRQLFDWVREQPKSSDSSDLDRRNRMEQCLVWTEMIDAYFTAGMEKSAVELLEKMLNTPNGENFTVAEPPLPASNTMTTAIKGFSQVDLNAATEWMERLLKQPTVSSPENRFDSVFEPRKPEARAWREYIYQLVQAGSSHLPILNRMWTEHVHSGSGAFSPSTLDRALVVTANYNHLVANPGLSAEEVKATTNFIAEKVLLTHDTELFKSALPTPLTAARYAVIKMYIEMLLKTGETAPQYVNDATGQTVAYIKSLISTLDDARRSPTVHLKSHKQLMVKRVNKLLRLVFYGEGGKLVTRRPACLLPQVAGIARFLHSNARNFLPGISFRIFTDMYREALEFGGGLELIEKDFDVFFMLDRGPVDTSGRGEPIAPFRLTPTEMLEGLRRAGKDIFGEGDTPKSFMRALVHDMGPEATKRFLLDLDSRFQKHFDQGHSRWLTHNVQPSPTIANVPLPTESTIPSPTETPRTQGTLSINDSHSRFVDEYYPFHKYLTVVDGFKRFREGLKAGLWPQAQVIGRLINGMGRAGDLDAVRYLYDSAQTVLQAMENQKEKQSLAWFQIEDQMIIAYAQADQPDLANVHRQRILEMGGVPSADAYAALIRGVKNSTDDTAVALSIWQESRDRGVVPNNYLYNNVISRLAKARKADQAIDLFHEMKEQGIQPTTVTYGAVITACCRVADAVSAEALFEEMRLAPRYKARIPPFNTMIQLFTTSHPNRERVEYYWNLMEKSRVQPSEHTYKLLLDCYGSIEPVDFTKMWDIFNKIGQDHTLNVNGSHWSAIINAVGCVGKDLEKAEQIFAGIATHPAVRKSKHPLPDSVCFEAIFNVLLAHHRFDKCEHYLRLMHERNVQMTAYIANLLIRGYAASGDLAGARSMFESMSDAPFGVAAPDNHEPQNSVKSFHIPANSTVYREPSTWEAIIRAELAHNNTGEAMALLARMQQRGFPDAVVARVGAILYPPETEIQTPETSHTILSQEPLPLDTATASSPTSNQSTHGSSTPPTPLSTVFSSS